jgi:hypothetical protein
MLGIIAMSRNRKTLTVVTWLLAFFGGAWTMFMLLASSMGSGTGLIPPSDLLRMLPFSIPGIGSSLILLLQSRRGEPLLFWYWLVPALVAGIPFLLVSVEWFHQVQK